MKNRKLLRIITGAIIVLMVFTMDVTGFLDGPNAYFYDLFFRIRGSRQPGDEIVIVGVDEKTLAQLGKWPIERRHYARLLAHLGGARAVGLDILMPESSVEDEVLKQALLKHGRVVLPIHVGQEGRPVKPDQLLPGFPYGHVHAEQGLDGIIREVYHSVTCCGLVLPSFASAIYNASPNHDFTMSPVPREPSLDEASKFVAWSDAMLINYYGPGQTFLHISLVDILSGKGPGDDFFHDKIVLVGLTAPGIAGEVLTPFTEGRGPMTGVELQANVLANLLDGTRIVSVSQEGLWLSVLLLSVAAILLFPRFSAGLLALVWLITAAATMAGLFGIFVRLNVWVPVAPFLVSITCASVAAYIYELKNIQRSLYFSKRDWEESFNTIEDAIVIHDDHCAVVKANRVASERLSPFMLKLLQERCFKLKAHGLERVVSDSLDPEEVLDSSNDRHYEIRSLSRGEQGKAFAGAVQVVRDITERKHHEKEQQELQSMLVQAQKLEAIGMLAGGIAHDFNNILASIMGYAELAYYQSPSGGPVRAKIEEVLKASKRARDIISQILVFTKHTPQENKVFKLGLVVHEAIKLIRVTLPATIEIQVDIRSSASVSGDPAQMYQVLLNLCTNAYHSMKDGGTLRVALEDTTISEPLEANGLVLQPGHCFHLSVSDTGHGIPAELQHRIFDPFFSTKPQGEGTGLGLSTVRGIVQELGGVVSFETHPGRGTIFHIYAPVQEEPAAAEGLPEPAPAPGEGHILLIDDERSITDLVSEMLESFGYRVTAMNNPLDALMVFQQQPGSFDVIITDMAMPKMTGEEFAEKVLEITPSMPIVLCTGFADRGLVERLRSKGIQTLMQKPFRMSALSDTIRSLLRK